MKNTNKSKLLNGAIAIGIIVLLVSIPFVGTLNSTPLALFSVSITPQQEYRIQFDLPHIKPVTPEIRQKAEAHLSEVFGIPQPIFKSKNLLSKPFVVLKRSFVTNTYTGYIKIGSATIPFSKVKVQFSNNDNKNEPPPKLLLTAYFTVNTTPFRANIFIINSGSVLQYASMTVQDEEDNVLAMFTHGRAEKQAERNTLQDREKKSSLYEKPVTTSDDDDGGDAGEFVLRSYVKDITIGAYGQTRTVHGLRTDAMEMSPFRPDLYIKNRLSIRSWGFRKSIVDAYKSIYAGLGYNPTTITVHLGASKIDNIIENEYKSAANITNDTQFRFPLPSGYSSIPLSISFVLRNISISYTINVPYEGVKKTWIYKHTAGSGNTDYNYAEIIADPFYDYTWNDKHLFWPDKYYNNPYLQNPGSSYGGFYAKQGFTNDHYGSGFYSRFTSSYVYSISVSVPFYGTDYYYFSVYNTFDHVKVDVKRPKDKSK